MKKLNKYSLIAPCWINCGVCMAHLRKKNKCPGCRGDDAGKPITRIICKIKTCLHFQKKNLKFCFSCSDFPCGILEHLDKRYRTKYKVNVIENLNFIKKYGVKKFQAEEKIKWTCLCGGTVCVHKGHCLTCGRCK